MKTLTVKVVEWLRDPDPFSAPYHQDVFTIPCDEMPERPREFVKVWLYFNTGGVVRFIEIISFS